MIWNFEYLIVFTSAHGVLPEQNDRYRIQPCKVNKIKVYKNMKRKSRKDTTRIFSVFKNLYVFYFKFDEWKIPYDWVVNFY